MSTASEISADMGLPLTFYFHGETVSLAAPGGAGANVSALLHDLGDNDNYRQRGFALLEADASSVTRGYTVTHGGEVWLVLRVTENDAGYRVLECALATSVSYRVAATNATTADVYVVREHTSAPLEDQDRRYLVPTAVIANPGQPDQITEEGHKWTVYAADMAVDGLVRVHTKRSQVPA